MAIFSMSKALCAQSISITDSIFKLQEDSLVNLLSNISRNNSNEKNAEINNAFKRVLHEVLMFDGSFGYDFLSLSKKIGIITSSDEKLKLYNWNIILNDGSYNYFCLMQIVNENSIEIVELTDKSAEIDSPESKVLSADSWFGALYYDIVVISEKKKQYYTLLGWDGNDFFTNKKVVDVLTIENNTLKFGADIFKYGKKNPTRIFFEYSNKAAMTLTYNSKLNMIVFDHLSPSQKMYEGHYQYYGPDFSYDGLYWKNGKWILEEDIDVKSPKIRNKKKKNKLTPTQVFFEQNQ